MTKHSRAAVCGITLALSLALALAQAPALAGKKKKKTGKSGSKKERALAAAESGDFETVRKLIDSGVDVDVVNADGTTPLMKAGKANNLELYRFLIERGAEVNRQNTYNNWTALHGVTRYSGSADAARLLLEAGADPRLKTKDGWSAVELAAQHQANPQLMRLLLERSGVESADRAHGEKSWTALHYAARYNASAEVAALLLDHGWSLDKPTDDGLTALMLAAHGGHPETVRLLLGRGADVLAEDGDGKTPVDWARGAKHAPIVSVLEGESRRIRIEQMDARDRNVAPAIRRDKYMVALTAHLKQGTYGKALIYFELLNRLGGELPDSFTFFYGESLLRTGQQEQAVRQLYAYLEAAGPEAQHYARALELVNEAEELP